MRPGFVGSRCHDNNNAVHAIGPGLQEGHGEHQPRNPPHTTIPLLALLSCSFFTYLLSTRLAALRAYLGGYPHITAGRLDSV